MRSQACSACLASIFYCQKLQWLLCLLPDIKIVCQQCSTSTARVAFFSSKLPGCNLLEHSGSFCYSQYNIECVCASQSAVLQAYTLLSEYYNWSASVFLGIWMGEVIYESFKNYFCLHPHSRVLFFFFLHMLISLCANCRS